jgi:hypothetical protein
MQTSSSGPAKTLEWHLEQSQPKQRLAASPSRASTIHLVNSTQLQHIIATEQKLKINNQQKS